jgi:hypothetical protein
MKIEYLENATRLILQPMSGGKIAVQIAPIGSFQILATAEIVSGDNYNTHKTVSGYVSHDKLLAQYAWKNLMDYEKR